MPRNLVILLHGVGSNGQDIASLGAFWNDTLPDTAFAAPDAPFPFPHGHGHQWFSVDGVIEANRPARVQAARAEFDRVVGEIVARHDLTDHPERVALAGFSQGAIMALDVLASGRWQPAGIVAFSGRLASPPPIRPATATPLLLVHGAADPVMPPVECDRAAAALQALGVQVQRLVLPGLGHSISAEGAKAAGAFLAGVFSPG